MRRLITVFFLSLAVLFVAPAVSFAQSGGEQIVTIAPKPHLKKNRFEATILGGWMPSNPFLTYFPLELRLGFHLAEGFAIEATGGYYLPVVKNDINELLKTHPHYLGVRIFEEQIFYANLDMVWTPVYGKFRFFGLDWIGYWEIYFQFGAGVTGVYDFERIGPNTDTEIRNPMKMRPTVNFGAGARLWITDWFNLRVDLRQFFFQKQVGRGGLSQHTLLLGGFSFII